VGDDFEWQLIVLVVLIGGAMGFFSLVMELDQRSERRKAERRARKEAARQRPPE